MTLRATGARLAALAFVLAAVAVSPAACADALSEEDGLAVRAAIAGQMAAFARDDAEAAFAFAAPGIQAKFGNPSTFIAMVRAAYRPVYRPREVSFRELRLSGPLPVQEVLVVDADGVTFLALYPMQRQPDGTWRIAGCVLTRWEGGAA